MVARLLESIANKSMLVSPFAEWIESSFSP